MQGSEPSRYFRSDLFRPMLSGVVLRKFEEPVGVGLGIAAPELLLAPHPLNRDPPVRLDFKDFIGVRQGNAFPLFGAVRCVLVVRLPLFRPLRRQPPPPRRCFARLLHISRPDSGRSLPNRDLQMRIKNFALEAPPDFGNVCRFEEQLQGFGQIAPRFFDGVALACDVQFGAKSNKAVALALDDSHKLLKFFHPAFLTPPISFSTTRSNAVSARWRNSSRVKGWMGCSTRITLNADRPSATAENAALLPQG